MKSETSQTEEKTREKDGEAAGRVSPRFCCGTKTSPGPAKTPAGWHSELGSARSNKNKLKARRIPAPSSDSPRLTYFNILSDDVGVVTYRLHKENLNRKETKAVTEV